MNTEKINDMTADAEVSAGNTTIITEEASLPVKVEKNMKQTAGRYISVVDTFSKEINIAGKKEAVDWNREKAFMMGLQNIQGLLDNAIFARIKVEDNGLQQIEFCQRYTNGKFSAIMSVKQSELIMANRAEKAKKQIAKDVKKADKFFEKMGSEYYGKLSVNIAEILDIREIADTLLTALPLLPIKRNFIKELKREEVYKKIVSFAKTYDYAVEEHREFFAFCDEMFVGLAESMELSKLGLIEKLEKEELLYISDSVTGYKNNVRTHDEDGNECMKRCYCIRKIMLIDEEPDEKWHFNF